MDTTSTLSEPLDASPPTEQRLGGTFLFFGVLLPISALGTEVATRLCAEVFFDPVPTLLHGLLIAFVAAVHVALWHVLRRPGPIEHGPELTLASGLALGVSASYAFFFLPLFPIGVVLTLVGLGLFLLAPALAVGAAVVARRRLRPRLPETDRPLWRRNSAIGLVAGLFLVIGAELPATLTRTGLVWATSSDAEAERRGLWLLRTLGDDDVLLTACYRSLSFERDMGSFLFSLLSDRHVSADEARRIYYRVNGRAFNAAPAPPSARAWASFDADMGGSSVGEVQQDLTLAQSRLDGSLDARAGVSYTEWTMVFSNETDRQREARARLRLPPGGVVSRVTLWIDGEEREAAFGGRAQVREAYQQVVRRRRDPLLVTTSGPGRVLVQCFPVPARGEMKIRLGITAPLLVTDPEEAVLRLPELETRNFALGTEHAVWVESEDALASPSLQATSSEDGKRFTVRGTLAARAAPSVVRARRAPSDSTAWTPDPHSGAHAVVQTLKPSLRERPRRVVLVVDASSSLAAARADVAAFAERLGASVDLQVLVAGDTVRALRATPERLDQVVHRLRRLKTQGGHDNAPALAAAWDRAAEHEDGVVVWIHGPQPVELGGGAALLQRFERRPDGPVLFEVQVGHGRNHTLEALDRLPGVVSLPHLGPLGDDLDRFAATLLGEQPRYEWARALVARPRLSTLGAAEQTSDHLARLWAAAEVEARRAAGDVEAARSLAIQHQLVTPVSGAVVLETQQQYDAAGLEPVEEGTVPTVPEPEVWLLLAVAGALFVLTHARQRRLLPAWRILRDQ